MSGPLHRNCTPTNCPAYARHVRQRFEWAHMKFIYSPTEKNRRAMVAARDAHVGEVVTRARDCAITQKEKAA